MDVDVAIVGGGLSGLVAAHRLLQAGVSSLAVFEAKDRVGGRTLTEVGPHLKPSTGPLIWAGTESAHIWTGYMDGAVRAGEAAASLVIGQPPPKA